MINLDLLKPYKRVVLTGHTRPDSDSCCSVLALNTICQKMGIKSLPIFDMVPNAETDYLLRRFKIPTSGEAPKSVKTDVFVMLDHNDPYYTPKFVDKANVVGMIDHHLITPKTFKPSNTFIAKVGSTCTLIVELYKSLFNKLDVNSARLLIGGILSDSKGFKSTFFNPRDLEAYYDAMKYANLKDTRGLYAGMQASKAKLSADKLLEFDMKSFELDNGSGHVDIANVITDRLDKLISSKERELRGVINNYSDRILFLVDPVEKKSCIFYTRDIATFVENKLSPFATEIESQKMMLPFSSRKTQLVQALTE